MFCFTFTWFKNTLPVQSIIRSVPTNCGFWLIIYFPIAKSN